MELLLPMAAQKLDLTFNIEADVPAWVYSDYARIRQGRRNIVEPRILTHIPVLMNLIGNAVKFTAGGSVRVLCSVDGSMTAPDEVHLKFAIQCAFFSFAKILSTWFAGTRVSALPPAMSSFSSFLFNKPTTHLRAALEALVWGSQFRGK